jgi:hypothetical protein
MPRNSIYDSRNVHLRRGAIIKRNGFKRFNSHPINYLQPFTCDAGEAWTVDEDSISDETTIKKEGTGSKKLTCVSFAARTAEYTPAGFVDMGEQSPTSETVDLWVYFQDAATQDRYANVHRIHQMTFRFHQWIDTEYFEYTLTNDYPGHVYTMYEGWNFFSLPKNDFVETSTPIWANIRKVEIDISFALGAPPAETTGYIYIDDIVVAGRARVENIIDFIQKDQTQKILVYGDDGDLVQHDVGAETWSDIITGLSGDRLGWTIFNNHLIAGNANDDNFKYKDAQSKLGIVEPPGAPTFNLNIAGNMETGNYYYRFVYYNSSTAHKSNPSPASAIMNEPAGPGGIRINIPADGGIDPQVDEVRVYRTIKNATVNSEYFRIPGSFTWVGGGFTVDDTFSDIELLDDLLAFDNNPPSKFKMVVHDGVFVYYAGDPAYPSRVWRSKIGDAESVPLVSFTDVAPDDGELITALGVTENSIVVAFKQNSKYRIVRGTFELVTARYINDRGTLNNETVRQIPQGLAYQSNDSVWVYNGTNDVELGQDLRSDLRGLAGATNNAGLVSYDRFDNIIRVATVPGGQTETEIEYAFDVHERAWVPHDKAYTAVGEVIESNQPIDLVGTVQGYVFRQEDGSVDTDDDELDFVGYVKTRFEDMGFPSRMKKFRQLIIWVKAAGTFDLSCKFIKGYAVTEGNEVLIPLAGGAVWGTFVWGVDRWGSEEALRIEVPVPKADQVAAALQVKFSTSLKNQPFSIMKYEWLAQIMRRRA